MRKIGLKISLWVFVIIVLTMSFVLYVTTSRANWIIHEMSVDQARYSNIVFTEVFNQYRRMAAQRAGLVAGAEPVVQAILSRDDGQLRAALRNFSAGMDFLTLCDAEGVVLARTHDSRAGDSLMYLKAVSVPLETGQAADTVEQGTAVGFAIRGSAPIYDPNGRIIGVAVSGYDLSNTGIVDGIQNNYGCEATVFQGDTRVSTTVRDEDGRRITGAKADVQIAATVLQGAEYTGRRETNGVTYEVYCTPIESAGAVVGMLMTGIDIDGFLAEQNAVLRLAAVAAFIGIVFSAVAVMLVCRERISKPLRAIGNVAQGIRGGAAAGKISVGSWDEVGKLTSIFNDMVERLAGSTTSLNTLKAMMNGMDGNLYVSDFETDEILFVNDGMKRDFGLDDGAIGKKCWQMLQKGFTGRCSFCPIPQLRENPSATVWWEERSSVTGKHYKNTDRVIVWSGGRVAHLQHSIDITEIKRAEQEIVKAKELAEEANRAKGEFLSRMSHEIRTPMNAIIGLTDIELHRGPSKEAADIYRKVNSSAKHLLEIINDILDLSKIEADRIDLFQDQFELENMLSSAMLVASPRLEGKEVELLLNIALDVPRYVIGDQTRLWQVLKNFLDNSAKFTDRGKVVLTVYTDVDASDGATVMLRFVIEDTGIGISEDKLSRIFQPYTQIQNDAQKRYKGTGLGMVIAKQLCELMGGSMDIESRVGRGTTVRLRIPFRRAADAETNLDIVRVPELEGSSILIADDNALSLEIMRRLLAHGGADCVTARSGREAVDIVCDRRGRGKRFDLILLDYQMEDIDGLQAARQIHQALSESPKVLMVTAYQRRLIKNKPEKCHIADVIEKPFVPSRFIRKVCAALGHAEDTSADGEPEAITIYENVHVLLCEDYVLNQEVAAGMMGHFGIEATIAENGQQGLDILNSGKKFDLILMDLHMPVMDGYEAARAIRADRRFDGVPIVSLTADAMKEAVDRCLEAGMDGHVAKPIEFSDLEQVFLKWLPKNKRAHSAKAPEADPASKAAGLARFGGSRERYEEAMRHFARELPDTWPPYEDAESGPLRRLIHGVKGMAGNISETEIYECARDLESRLLAGEPGVVLYERLIALCAEAKQRVTETAAGQTSGPAELGTPEELERLLERLGKVLREYDPVAVNDALALLKAKRWAEADEAWLGRLAELAESYEFEGALAILENKGG